MSPIVTQHAALRCGERGIPIDLVPLLQMYGSPSSHDGTRCLRFDTRAVNAAGAHGVSPQLLQMAKGIVLIMIGDVVVTAWRDGKPSETLFISSRRTQRREGRSLCREFLLTN